METKRCVLYIIRVQSGPNLMDILVRPITAEDETRWQMILREEFSSGGRKTGAYSEANTILDITSMTYAELKRTALENIVQLERSGRLSRHNHYQDLLNAIAVDIRTKHRRRIQRQRELEGVRLTLGNLNEKALWLEQQLKSYNDYIEQAMVTLQSKKGYVQPIPPPSSSLDCSNSTSIAKSDSLSPSRNNTTTNESYNARDECRNSALSNTRPDRWPTKASWSPTRAIPRNSTTRLT